MTHEHWTRYDNNYYDIFQISIGLDNWPRASYHIISEQNNIN